MKTIINCNVNSCKFYKDQKCNAHEISVSCDQVLSPNNSSQTACRSFTCK